MLDDYDPNKPNCISIEVPEYDPDYKYRKCIPLARSTTDIDLGLNDGSYAAEQVSY